MKSKFGLRLGAPIAAMALMLALAPAALAVPPTVTPSAGSYASQTPITIALSSNQPGTTIRYTTDGSEPSAASAVYSEPLTFTRTTRLRWLGTNSAGETSTGEETYTIDTNPPSVTIAVPADGALLGQFSAVKAYYWCADAELSYATCEGTVPYEGNVDTSTPGQKTFTVTSFDAAGNRTVKTSTYTVQPAAQTGGGVSGSVPATLALTMGATPSFGAFTAGVARDYTASTLATVTSSAGDATLSVSDPSSTATGRLMNGTFALAQPLHVSNGSTFAPVGGSSAPTTVKTWSGPVANDASTVTFRQSIAANEPLRSGTYSKPLTFTLSTTQP